MRNLLLALLVALTALLPALPASAHDARPVSVLIRELPGERFALRVRAPDSVAFDNRPQLLPPDGCSAVTIGAPTDPVQPSEMVVHCPGGVAGKSFRLDFPIYNPSLSALYRLERLGGEPLVQLLPPSEAAWEVPLEPSRWEVAGDYFRLGVEHIFGGLDHLLFVVGLLLISGTWRRSLLALTGFTVAHSVTLALSALDLVRLPTPPVEAVIALSILFLALEILRGDRSSVTFRYPVLVASLFGLLHGFGFASVLRDIGVPGSEIATALLSFNLGVEAGQVVFVLACLGVVALLSMIAARTPRLGTMAAPARATRLAAYALGTIAMFWLFERVSAFA